MVKDLIKSFKKFTQSQAELLQKSLSQVEEPNKNAFRYSDANVAKGAFTGDPNIFTITLIDIARTVKEDGIICTTKSLYEEGLEYVILSYRWGEVHEWVVKTPDYMAHITSFGEDDIEKLCAWIMKEPDLKYKKYLWVDTISIDQYNKEKKKETIYRMNEIYKKSAYILAVPDLHYSYLQRYCMNKKALVACKEFGRHIYTGIMAGIKGNERYEEHFQLLNSRLFYSWIYHHLHPDVMDDFDPEDLLSQLQSLEHELVFQDENASEDKNYIYNDESRLCYDFIIKALSDIVSKKGKKRTPYLRAYKEPDYLAIRPGDNADPSQFEIFFEKIQQEENPDLGDLKVRFDEWRKKYTEFVDALNNAYVFLMDLMEDWSNRTWVISEYHIAKQEGRENKFKYMFISLCGNLPDLLCGDDEDQYTPFFSILGKTKSISYIEEDDDDDDDEEFNKFDFYEKLTGFHREVEGKLKTRDHLDMMLNSYASRHADRFHAILPTWDKYCNVIKDKNTISDWDITDFVSVRLKLYEFMDLKDKIRLLHACSYPFFYFIEPSFATCYNNSWLYVDQLHSLQLDDIPFDDKYTPECNFYTKAEIEIDCEEEEEKVEGEEEEGEEEEGEEEEDEEEEGEDEEEEDEEEEEIIGIGNYRDNITDIQLEKIDSGGYRLAMKADVFYVIESHHYYDDDEGVLKSFPVEYNKRVSIIVPIYIPNEMDANYTEEEIGKMKHSPCFIQLMYDGSGETDSNSDCIDVSSKKWYLLRNAKSRNDYEGYKSWVTNFHGKVQWSYSNDTIYIY